MTISARILSSEAFYPKSLLQEKRSPSDPFGKNTRQGRAPCDSAGYAQRARLDAESSLRSFVAALRFASRFAYLARFFRFRGLRSGSSPWLPRSRAATLQSLRSLGSQFAAPRHLVIHPLPHYVRHLPVAPRFHN
jgi:hypothetical protein